MTNNSQDWGSRPISVNPPAPTPMPPSGPEAVPPLTPRQAAIPTGGWQAPPPSPEQGDAPSGPMPMQPIASAQPARPTPAARQPVRVQPPQSPPARRRSGCAGVAFVVLIIVALGVLAFGLVLVGYAGIARDLPMPDELQAVALPLERAIVFEAQEGTTVPAHSHDLQTPVTVEVAKGNG